MVAAEAVGEDQILKESPGQWITVEKLEAVE